MFQWDEIKKCYLWEAQSIRISCENQPEEEGEGYALQLAEQYPSAINKIAQYISGEREFQEVYEKPSIEQTLDLLKNSMSIPWIFLQGNDRAMIAYCDEDYVLEFECMGIFSDFQGLTVSS